MPGNYTSPGVYIEEIRSGVRTITGVATSITAFVGRARRGPINKATTINSFGDFERIFGGLWQESTMSFTVRDFYLNGGSQAVIVRVFNPIFDTEEERQAAHEAALEQARTAAQKVADAAQAAADDDATERPQDVVNAAMAAVEGEDSSSPAAIAAARAVANAAKASTHVTLQEVAVAARDAAASIEAEVKASTDTVITAANNVLEGDDPRRDSVAGAADEAAEAVDDEKPVAKEAARAVAKAAKDMVNNEERTPQEVAVAARDAAASIEAEVKAAATAVADAAKDAVAVAAGAQAVADAANEAVAAIDNEKPVAKAAAEAVAKAAQDVIVTKKTVADAAEDAVDTAASNGADVVAPVARARLNVRELQLEAANEGAWGNKLRARIDHDVLDGGEEDLFNLSIRDGSTGEIEIFRNLSVAEHSVRRVDKVLENGSMLVRTLGVLPPGAPAANRDPGTGGDPFGKDNSDSVTVDALDGNPLETNDYLGNEATKKGIYALLDTDLFNLLCIPPFTEQTDVIDDVWTAAATFCEARRAMLLVDAPSGWTRPDLAINGISNMGTNSKNAALFFPRLCQRNPLRDGQVETFAASGAIAGVMARTDAERGIWKAPAGLDATLRGVSKLSAQLTDAENGQLNPLGINCLRNMPPSGSIIWGARTMEGDDRRASEWKYIPVRRTALYIEESLYRGLKVFVFEPNDEPLWAEIRLNVGVFMHDLFRQGAFQGTKPQDAYLVKCDHETTTQSDINKGIVNIVVGFAPLKPAEFVILKIQQLVGQLAV